MGAWHRPRHAVTDSSESTPDAHSGRATNPLRRSLTRLGNARTVEFARRLATPDRRAPGKNKRRKNSDEFADPGPSAPAAGRPLPDGLRSRFERAFRFDFRGVRIHVDDAAERLETNAYTRGANIHINRDAYDPYGTRGRELIGHELAHVVQQHSGRVGRPHVTSGAAPINSDSALEREADVQGKRAARGELVRAQGRSYAAPTGGETGEALNHAADGGAAANADTSGSTNMQANVGGGGIVQREGRKIKRKRGKQAPRRRGRHSNDDDDDDDEDEDEDEDDDSDDDDVDDSDDDADDADEEASEDDETSPGRLRPQKRRAGGAAAAAAPPEFHLTQNRRRIVTGTGPGGGTSVFQRKLQAAEKREKDLSYPDMQELHQQMQAQGGDAEQRERAYQHGAGLPLAMGQVPLDPALPTDPQLFAHHMLHFQNANMGPGKPGGRMSQAERAHRQSELDFTRGQMSSAAGVARAMPPLVGGRAASLSASLPGLPDVSFNPPADSTVAYPNRKAIFLMNQKVQRAMHSSGAKGNARRKSRTDATFATVGNQDGFAEAHPDETAEDFVKTAFGLKRSDSQNSLDVNDGDDDDDDDDDDDPRKIIDSDDEAGIAKAKAEVFANTAGLAAKQQQRKLAETPRSKRESAAERRLRERREKVRDQIDARDRQVSRDEHDKFKQARAVAQHVKAKGKLLKQDRDPDRRAERQQQLAELQRTKLSALPTKKEWPMYGVGKKTVNKAVAAVDDDDDAEEDEEEEAEEDDDEDGR